MIGWESGSEQNALRFNVMVRDGDGIVGELFDIWSLDSIRLVCVFGIRR